MGHLIETKGAASAHNCRSRGDNFVLSVFVLRTHTCVIIAARAKSELKPPKAKSRLDVCEARARALSSVKCKRGRARTRTLTHTHAISVNVRPI